MKRTLCWMFILGLVVSVGMIGCAKKEKEIKIGAILPLTGPAAQFGQYAKEGIELALEEIKTEDSAVRLRVLFEDSQGDPKNAVSIVNKFIKIDKVRVILVLTSSETMAIAPIITKEKVVTFTGTLLPAITDQSPYLFRNATHLSQETHFMAKFLVEEKGKPSVGVIYINNDAGLVAEKEFRNKYTEYGGKIVAEESYNPGDTDFRTQLSKIKERDPEYLYILSYKEYGLIMKQAREMGLKSHFIGTTTFEDPSGVRVARDAAEGAIYTVSAFDPNSSVPVLMEFQKKYIEKYGRKAELYAALMRDNIHILALALKSDPKDPDQLKEVILKIGIFQGASGETKFLPNRDVEKPLTLKVIRNGSFQFLKQR